MTFKLENIEENKVKLTCTVDKDQFNEALDYAFKKVVKDINYPGFRKGKLPRNIFEKKFGVEALYEEAINYLIPKVYPKFVEEANIEPVAQPQIDFDYENMGKDKPFTFYATIVVKPKVKLGQYKGIEVKPLSTEVTDEDVDKEIANLLKQHAELVVKEDAASLNDTVVIDYEGFKDGVPFEGGKAQNYSLKLGSNSFIPGFEEQLVGIKANEERTIQVTFPEDYHAEDLKGKACEFKVKCHEVKSLNEPELNDDFVLELNRENINTVEELKADIKSKLINRKEAEAKNHIIDTVVDVASNNAEINIPQEMIDYEADMMIEDAKRRFEQQGFSFDLYLKYTGNTQESLHEEYKANAVKKIRYNLTLEQIAEEEKIEVTEEDLEKEFAQLAEKYQMEIEQVKSFFPSTKELELDIKMRKAVDLLVYNAKKVE